MNKEIVIPVGELKAALPGLNKIVSKRTTLPVLQSIRVARDAEGKVSLMGTDLDGFATYTVTEPQPGAPVEFLMPLEQLTKTVKSLNAEDTLSLTPESKEKVKLRYSIAGNLVEQNVNTLAANEFPPAPKFTQPAILLQPGFGRALRQALECCSEDSSRYILKGACLDVRDEKFHYVVGSNGRCLYSANSFGFELKKSVIIPDSRFLEWPDLLDEQPASLSVEPGEEAEPAKDGKPAKEGQPGWVKLESGRWTFMTKEIYGEFPNWKQVVPTTDSRWTRVHLSDEAMKQLVLLTPNLPGSEGFSHAVRLRITEYHLNLEGRNKEDEDWTSIPVGAEVKGKPVTVALNRHYLLNALRFGLNELEVENSLSPVVFSNGGRKMVIMPINLDGPGKVTPPAPAASEATPVTPATTPPTEQTAPQAQPGAPTEERKDMSESTNTLPPRGNLTGNGNGNGAARKHEETDSALSAVTDKIDSIKTTLRQVITELTEAQSFIKTAAKEKRATEKEVESVRTALRSLQKVEL